MCILLIICFNSHDVSKAPIFQCVSLVFKFTRALGIGMFEIVSGSWFIVIKYHQDDRCGFIGWIWNDGAWRGFWSTPSIWMWSCGYWARAISLRRRHRQSHETLVSICSTETCNVIKSIDKLNCRWVIIMCSVANARLHRLD